MNAPHSGSWLTSGDPLRCEVLIVDDDRDCAEECAETVSALGYDCHSAADGPEALRLIADNGRIGIVVADLFMPGVDGITLLDEIAARFSSSRPLVPIVMTGAPTFEFAVRAMRLNAIDFLEKPTCQSALAAALRRASTRWTHLVAQFRFLALGLRAAGATVREAPFPGPPSDRRLLQMVRTIKKLRRTRDEILGGALFSDPSWDILLELTEASLEGKVVAISSVCTDAQVAPSTSLRHVRHLMDLGMIRRWPDQNDKRRSLLELEEKALALMTQYLAAISEKQLLNAA